jgi:inner membrane protein
LIAGTHIAFASALYVGGAGLFEYRADLVGWALAAGASLLPDIDLPTSKVGRILFWASTRMERNFGHRTITHSLLALLTVAALASFLYLFEPVWFWAVVGGYWSHLWIDMANIRGADLFWPSPVRVVFPGNRRYRIEAGSKAEMILFTVLILFTLMLYPVSGMGFRVGLQHLLGNFDMAHDSYLKNAGEHWYTLRLEARDNLSLEQVRGDYPIVGVWRKGLVVLTGDELRAVGMSETAHNLYPTHAELVQGEPLRVVSHRVDMRGRSLRWLLERLDTKPVYFISGEMRMGATREPPVDGIDLYRPARFSGKVLRLQFARARELAPYLGMVAAEGELYVQVWLKPGDAAVELSWGGESQEALIPAALRGYL